jgi:putative membrane-bound dehydrogenase-like protein
MRPCWKVIRRVSLFLPLACGVALWFEATRDIVGTAAEPAAKPTPDFSAELPRIPAKSPAEALNTFQVLPGFRIEQIAAEPLVHDPVAVSFDENGRMYVVEMIDYSEQANDFLGSIRLLEDTDSDGKFEKSTLFVDKMSWPTAITCYDGGVFIGAAPDIWYCKDTDGDGKSDIRKKVFTGFARSNVQGLINSFHWGYDNRIRGATGTVGGQVVRADIEGAKPVILNGRDFAFDPKTLEMTAVTGGAQHGLSFDNFGRAFHCSNSDHCQLTMYEDRYAARNPFVAAPPSRISIAADGPQAEVFRISPVEPWRIVRTRLRVTGQVVGMVEGGGRAAGYFTGATGTTIYRGDAFPPEYVGQAFVGDVGSNIIHRKTVKPNGVGFIADRADPGREFVASTDIWFRPAQYANAPDGCLHICDVYREVIEHPASLPPEIKKHLDLTSGRDRGRLYRVVPEGYVQKPVPKLGSVTTAELVATLESKNGWHRDTAARLLFERQDPSAVSALVALLAASKEETARWHALWVLEGMKAITPAHLAAALKDASPRVRELAIRLAESRLAETEDLVAACAALANDGDIRVRYQLAFTAGVLPDEKKVPLIASVARSDISDNYVRFAMLSSLATGGPELFDNLIGDADYRARPDAREFLIQLAGMAGQSANEAFASSVLKGAGGLAEAESVLAGGLIRSLFDGLSRAGSPLRGKLLADGGEGVAILKRMLAAARTNATRMDLTPAQRTEAIRTLALGSYADSADLYPGLLTHQQPQEVQLATLTTLSRFSDDAIAELLIKVWPTLGPRVRGAATDLVFARPVWLKQLLAAMEAGSIPLTDVEPTRIRLLDKHPDESVRTASAPLAAKLKVGRRQDVLAAYKSVSTLTGDPAKGKPIFQKICATCHKVEGFGHELGPNLATFKARGAEALLLNILDPNSEVNPQYLNYVCELDDGRVLSGMIASETATSVVLRRAENATDTILRGSIHELRSTGQSLMPEGMEKDIPPQAMADLIAYLLSAP